MISIKLCLLTLVMQAAKMEYSCIINCNSSNDGFHFSGTLQPAGSVPIRNPRGGEPGCRASKDSGKRH